MTIRAVDPTDPDEVERWTELVVRGFGLDGAEASAMADTNGAPRQEELPQTATA